MTQVALYQPDIPPHVGTILRLGACLDVTVHIIEPASFAWSETNPCAGRVLIISIMYGLKQDD